MKFCIKDFLKVNVMLILIKGLSTLDIKKIFHLVALSLPSHLFHSSIHVNISL
jgi:hypothetical protein